MEKTFVTVNNVKLHVVSHGPQNGSLVILLHGFPEHWYSWRHQLKALGDAGFFAVAPDQRGYNLSDKPQKIKDYSLDTLTQDVAELIRHYGREKAIIVGHDWGGVVAFRFAMDYPKMTQKLIIMNAPHPNAFAREIKKFRQLKRSWYMFYFFIPWLPEKMFLLAPQYWAQDVFHNKSFNKDAFDAEEIQTMVKAWQQPGAMRSMLHWYRAAFLHKPKNHTLPIQSPTLIIWGMRDFALGPALIENMAPWFEGSLQIERIEDSSHWVQNEAPHEVNNHLLSFVGNIS
jgi:epoxide hydrolase 4